MWPHDAGHGLTCLLVVPPAAGCGPMSPGICRRWLPGFSLAALTLECAARDGTGSLSRPQLDSRAVACVGIQASCDGQRQSYCACLMT